MRIPKISLPRPTMPKLGVPTLGMPTRHTAWRYGRFAIGAAVLALVVAILPGNEPKSKMSTRLVPDKDSNALIPGVVQPDGSVVTTDGSTVPGVAGSVPGPPGTKAAAKARKSRTAAAKGAAAAAKGAGSGGPGTTARSDGTSSGTGGTTGGTGGSGGGGAGGGGDGGGGGGGDDGGAIPAANCRSDGRMAGFSLYMPPCVPVFTASNGGATSQGVYPDKVVVVRYVSQLPPGLQQLMQAVGADDGEAKNAEMDAALVDFFNDHMETYRREVVVVTKQASGTDDNQSAMRNDALAIVNEHRPFAVFHTQPGAPDPVFAETLASKSVICICAIVRSSSLYRANKPYIWSTQPMLQEFYQATAEYLAKRLRDGTRRFGLVYVNGQSTPDASLEEGKQYYLAELARHGVDTQCDNAQEKDCLALVKSYLFNPQTIAQFQIVARDIITAMKDAGVNNLLCACDPFGPIFLTRQASQAQYSPQWLVNGIGFSETTFFGRTRDQNQWRNAFGIGAFPVPSANIASTPAHKAFMHMRPGATPGKGIIARQWSIQMLFTGIHMAGPNLSPASFAQGMYNYPATGGQPKFPLVYYTPDSPAQPKDFTEIFWDVDARGQDEAGTDGQGVMRRAEAGRRYQVGQWPGGGPSRNAGVIASDNPAESSNHDADRHSHQGQRCRSCR